MVAFLTFATVVLLFVVLVLIARANELTADLKNGKVDYTNQSKWNGYFLLAFLVFMFVGSAMCFKILTPVMVPKAASMCPFLSKRRIGAMHPLYSPTTNCYWRDILLAIKSLMFLWLVTIWK